MEEESKDTQTQPGQYLAYEREKKGLAAEDVARKLYLSPHVIRSLEEDAYDGLPERVYVRGYIRSYCKLLGIDPEPILEMYTENLPQEENQVLEDLSLDSPVNERQQRLIVIFGSIVVAAIFLTLFISWWQENQSADLNKPLVSTDEPVERPKPEGADISDAPTEQESIPQEPESPPLISQDEVIPVEQPKPEGLDIPNAPTEQESIPLEPESLPLLDPTELKIKKVGDGNLHGEPSETTASATLGNTDDTISTEPNNQQRDGIDDASQLVTLVVMSRGDSWARVRDGSGEIFIHRILPIDYNKIFMVNLPLKFELGNAHNVSIMVDGKDYDFSSHIRPSRTASFEVSKLP